MDTLRQLQNNRFSIGALWICILGLLVIDQLTVRLSGLRFTDFSSWRYWANQLTSAFFLFGLIILLGSYLGALCRRGKIRLMQLALLMNAIELSILFTLQSNHFLIYQKPFSSFSVRFVFENPELMAELASENIDIWQSVLRVVPAVLPVIFLLRWCANSDAISRAVKISGGMSLLGSLALATFAWAAAPTMQHSLLSASAAFTDLIRMPDNFYKTEVPGQRNFTNLKCNVGESAGGKPSVIWVVGESLVASRMSLYGYKRKTTDFLVQEWQADRLLRFNNAVSIGTVTRVSVPYLFFGLQGPDSNGRLYRTPSIFDYAKAAGLKTAFIGAQELRWGNQDKIIINGNVDLFKSGTDFDRSAGISKGAEDFKVLTEGAIPYLNSAQAPFFLTLHMDGSHYPYSTHSLPQFKKFLPELTANDDNAYDNTVVQFDAYMRELLSVVRARHPGTWVFYSSDHGQNLSKESLFNSGYSDNVIRNPLFVFPPKNQGEGLNQNTGSPISQADLFATTLVLWGCAPPESTRGESMSLFGSVPKDRLRTVSGLMTSHMVDETVAIVLPNRQKIEVDYAKGAVMLPNGRVIPLSSWRSPARRFLERYQPKN